MIRSGLLSTALIAAVTSCAAGADLWESAAEAPTDDLAACQLQISQLQSDVAMLQTQLNAGHGCCGDGCQPSPLACCEECANGACGRWDAAADLMFLWPHTTNNQIDGFAFFRETGFDPAWRLSLGYSTPRNIGVRARYWDFDHRTTEPLNGFFYDLDTAVLDVEATNGFAVGKQWSFLVSAGARYVNFEEVRGAVGGSVVSQVVSERPGLVIGGEARRDLIGGVRSYLITRGAAVYGDGREEASNFDLTNNFSTMWECQFGLEGERQYRFGRLILRAGFESQAFNGFTTAHDAGNNTFSVGESVGLVGFVTGISLLR